MTETAFSRLYKTGILVLLFIVSVALIVIAFKEPTGRYIKYNSGDLILDTKTAKIYKYDILTMKLMPYHPETLSP